MTDIFTNAKLFVSFSVATLLYAAVAGLLINWWDSYTLLSAVIGIVSGWIGGILLAPYESESKQFKGYSKAAGAFVTGFVVAKFDRVFDLLIDKDRGLQILDPVVERRIWITVSCFLITAVVVFVARTYWQAVEEEAG